MPSRFLWTGSGRRALIMIIMIRIRSGSNHDDVWALEGSSGYGLEWSHDVFVPMDGLWKKGVLL